MDLGAMAVSKLIWQTCESFFFPIRVPSHRCTEELALMILFLSQIRRSYGRWRHGRNGRHGRHGWRRLRYVI